MSQVPKPSPRQVRDWAIRDGGGPAFARGAGPEGAEYSSGDPGMSLRAWLAGQALGALAWPMLPAEDPNEVARYMADVADMAVGYADAVLARLAKGGDS